MEEATAEGPKITKQPCFGAQYMLFRVMMLGGKAVSFSRSEGNILAEEAVRGRQGGGKVGQMWH